MLQSKKNKSGKLFFVIKMFLALLALWFVYLKIINHESSGDYLNQMQMAFRQPGSVILFTSVFLLMFLNWFTEAIKWKFMIDKIESITTGRALEAVFSGITISFFTPNRIGEYAGRVFHLTKGKRMQATLITVIENSSQLLVTILSGSIASIVFMQEYMELSPWIFQLMRILFILLSILSFILFFNIDLFEKIFQRFITTDYWKKIIHVFSLYTTGDLLKVFLLSVGRYVVFSLQFYLLLRAYGSYFSPVDGLLMIAMTFFVMSVVPTFTFAEIGIRSAVSAFFFGKLTADVLPVLNAAFSLWLINLALPALLGAIFIFNFRLEKIGK